MVWPAAAALPDDAGAEVDAAGAAHPARANEAARAAVPILIRTLSPFWVLPATVAGYLNGRLGNTCVSTLSIVRYQSVTTGATDARATRLHEN